MIDIHTAVPGIMLLLLLYDIDICCRMTYHMYIYTWNIISYDTLFDVHMYNAAVHRYILIMYILGVHVEVCTAQHHVAAVHITRYYTYEVCNIMHTRRLAIKRL